MNEFAFRHSQRLHFAARRLARHIQAMRREPALPKLYRELYESLEARLSAITRARRTFDRWLRDHPDPSDLQIRHALRKMNIPITRRDLRLAIREIEQAVRDQIRSCQ